MLTAIVVAVIGAVGSILAAMVTVLQKRQSEFREESGIQHGHLMAMVERIDRKTTHTNLTLSVLQNKVDDHLEQHHGVKPEEEAKKPSTTRKRTTVRK